MHPVRTRIESPEKSRYERILAIDYTLLGFNTIVLGLAAIFFSLEAALYTLIYMYATSCVVNLVVTGWSQRKTVLIISSKREKIHKGILHEIKRGATIIQGRGAYTDQ